MSYKMIGMGSDLRPSSTPQSKVANLPASLHDAPNQAVVDHLQALEAQADQVLLFTGSLSEVAQALNASEATTLQELMRQGRARLARKTSEREHKDWRERKSFAGKMAAKLKESP